MTRTVKRACAARIGAMAALVFVLGGCKDDGGGDGGAGTAGPGPGATSAPVCAEGECECQDDDCSQECPMGGDGTLGCDEASACATIPD